MVNDEAGLVSVTRNMMQDSSFENEIVSVTEKSAAVTSGPDVVTGQFVGNVTPYDGEKAVYFTCDTGTCNTVLDREIPVTPGRTYTISFYYATGSNVTGSAAQFKDGSGNAISGFNVTDTGESWMRASTTWTAPEDVTAIYPGFGIETTGFFLDGYRCHTSRGRRNSDLIPPNIISIMIQVLFEGLFHRDGLSRNTCILIWIFLSNWATCKWMLAPPREMQMEASRNFSSIGMATYVRLASPEVTSKIILIPI